jgi:hypothetical protein
MAQQDNLIKYYKNGTTISLFEKETVLILNVYRQIPESPAAVHPPQYPATKA